MTLEPLPIKPFPASGRCPCGCETLTLARDKTEFSILEVENGGMTVTYSDAEYLDAPDSVRVFCPDCGDYFEVPEELA